MVAYSPNRAFAGLGRNFNFCFELRHRLGVVPVFLNYARAAVYPGHFGLLP